MKIGIVQSSSIKGAIEQNIENHLRLIGLAVQSKVELIVFPELSITGYEPELAEKLASTIEDERFNSFQQVADTHSVTIGIGMPTRSGAGINISMIFFQPHQKRLLYAKQILHDDELPYFVSGKNQAFSLRIGKKIAFGICYETLSREHIVQAKNNGADIYIASVAKTEGGINKAYVHFPSLAKECSMPILMSNCVGYCDNFLSNGKSAAWNQDGELVAQLDGKHQGLLMYETELEAVTILQVDK